MSTVESAKNTNIMVVRCPVCARSVNVDLNLRSYPAEDFTCGLARASGSTLLPKSMATTRLLLEGSVRRFVRDMGGTPEAAKALAALDCDAVLVDTLEEALDRRAADALEMLTRTSDPALHVQPLPCDLPGLARRVSDAVGVPCVVSFTPYQTEYVLPDGYRTPPSHTLVAYPIPVVRGGP